MCGIHGFVVGQKSNTDADDFISNAFVAGSLRGTDSAGIASIRVADTSIEYQKLPISGPMFVDERYASYLMKQAARPDTITICHTRAATSGKIGINEAHPFFMSDDTGREMIGVHNGTLTHWWSKPGGNAFKVDSEWALNHIFKEQFDAFEDFTGAYCFVWWDSADKQFLNIALNNERPMYVAFTKDDGMAYASEAGMLYWLCERNRIKLEGPVIQLSGMHWYKFDVHNLSKFTKTALPEVKPAAMPVAQPYQHRPYQHSNHKTAMTKMKELMEALAGPAPVNVSGPRTALALVPATAVVTHTEQQNARDMMIMGERGEFIPNWFDEATGEVSGTWAQGSMEMDAIIRGGWQLKYDADSIWTVTVLGLIDNGTDLVVVCDKPVVSQVRSVAMH